MRAFGLLTALVLLTACATDIGDACSSDAECGTGRVCDRSSRGGYCTVSPCTPNSCPENSVCVEFENQQTFCMALCDNGGDCRGGYFCDKRTGAAPFCREKP
jgi:hypothetical protein